MKSFRRSKKNLSQAETNGMSATDNVVEDKADMHNIMLTKRKNNKSRRWRNDYFSLWKRQQDNRNLTLPESSEIKKLIVYACHKTGTLELLIEKGGGTGILDKIDVDSILCEAARDYCKETSADTFTCVGVKFDELPGTFLQILVLVCISKVCKQKDVLGDDDENLTLPDTKEIKKLIIYAFQKTGTLELLEKHGGGIAILDELDVRSILCEAARVHCQKTSTRTFTFVGVQFDELPSTFLKTLVLICLGNVCKKTGPETTSAVQKKIMDGGNDKAYPNNDDSHHNKRKHEKSVTMREVKEQFKTVMTMLNNAPNTSTFSCHTPDTSAYSCESEEIPYSEETESVPRSSSVEKDKANKLYGSDKQSNDILSNSIQGIKERLSDIEANIQTYYNDSFPSETSKGQLKETPYSEQKASVPSSPAEIDETNATNGTVKQSNDILGGSIRSIKERLLDIEANIQTYYNESFPTDTIKVQDAGDGDSNYNNFIISMKEQLSAIDTNIQTLYSDSYATASKDKGRYFDSENLLERMNDLLACQVCPQQVSSIDINDTGENHMEVVSSVKDNTHEDDAKTIHTIEDYSCGSSVRISVVQTSSQDSLNMEEKKDNPPASRNMHDTLAEENPVTTTPTSTPATATFPASRDVSPESSSDLQFPTRTDDYAPTLYSNNEVRTLRPRIGSRNIPVPLTEAPTMTGFEKVDPLQRDSGSSLRFDPFSISEWEAFTKSSSFERNDIKKQPKGSPTSITQLGKTHDREEFVEFAAFENDFAKTTDNTNADVASSNVSDEFEDSMPVPLRHQEFFPLRKSPFLLSDDVDGQD